MSEKIRYALISVSDKEGIASFASGLVAAGITLLSTGGTARYLKQQHIPVQDISSFTGFPEILDGRVKTLHPKVFAGILARGHEDAAVLSAHAIPFIGLVVVNLYPFEEVTGQANCSLETAIENIDIGGPSLLRAAAKNYHYTTAVVSKEDYAQVLTQIQTQGTTEQETRLNLAKKVFAHVAQYDACITNYFSPLGGETQPTFPATYVLPLCKKMDLRYGENPHQQAAFYTHVPPQQGANISNAVLHAGKPLSYNNIADADTALECVKQFTQPACVIVKHANPCAVSLGASQLEAYQKAFQADSISAFGGILAFNTPLEETTIEQILINQFVEVIIAPTIDASTLHLAQQKPNIRVLTVGNVSATTHTCIDYKSVNGGILVQEKDNLPITAELEIPTNRHPTSQELKDLLFAWQVARFVKSNAIVLAQHQSTIGIGPGQMSRVFSSRIAALKAQEAGFALHEVVMASDAFFPFRDSVDEAATLGVSAIIQPGGSVRDQDVIAAANEHNIAMVFTRIRHFRH